MRYRTAIYDSSRSASDAERVPVEPNVRELFEAQAARTPDSIALIFEKDALTYDELNARANQLAHHLMQRGVGPGTIVGICTERSLEMVVAVLGVFKAGGAYLPVDPAYPRARQDFMLEDARARIVLTQEHLAQACAERTTPTVCLDSGWQSIANESEQNPAQVSAPEDLAYVVYTSGSTGQPKGVMVEQRGLRNVAQQQVQTFGVGSQSRVLQFFPLGFDASIFEITLALVAGARLCLGTRDALLPGPRLIRLLREQAITNLLLTPSALAALPDDDLPALETVAVAGEACPAELAARWAKRCRFFNLYGPTEATIWTTVERCSGGDTAPTLGKAIANTRVHVLDAQQQPVGFGVPGEIHIGGVGVARGYLDQPALTAEKFLPDPFSEEPGSRLYRTGDLGCQLPNGSIEFRGRIDQQVKLRGFRIEPGEIEAALRVHPAVNSAAVAVVPSGTAAETRRLVAYVVLRSEPSGTTAELRDFLSRQLPEHMMPSSILVLDALPLTPHGKLDRSALPSPEQLRRETGGDGDESSFPARGAREEVLAGIWAEVLGREQIAADDDFFELGGHSLLATQIMARVSDALHTEVPLGWFFEHPTLSELSQRIEEQRAGKQRVELPVITPATRDADLPLSSAQERVWFLQQLIPENTAYHASASFRLEGSLDVEALTRSLSEICRRHEIFRTSFPAVDGRPVQLVHAPRSVVLPIADLSGLPESRRDGEVERLISQECRAPFDLSIAPLVRWKLVRRSADDHVLIHVEHHLLHDGWSFNVFLRELCDLYNAFSAGRPSPLLEPALQFVDFACWQRDSVPQELTDRQLDYWKSQLAGSPEVLNLPADRPRPALQTLRGDSLCIELPVELCNALRRLSRQQGVSLYMTMLAGFSTLLHRYTGEVDLCVGAGVANRRRRELEGVIGMVINTLPLRNDLSNDPTFRELLARVREVCMAAYDNQDVPFDRVVDAVQPTRSPSHSPLYQVMFSFHDSPLPNFELRALETTLTEGLNAGTAKLDLNVYSIPRLEQRVGRAASERDERITLVWEYSTDLFDAATMQRMLDHYLALLAGAVADPNLHLSELPLLTTQEARRLSVEWNDTRTDYPRDATLQQRFEAQASETPEAVAVVFGDETLTYDALNRRANQLARHLLEIGVGPDVLVGLCVERSPEMLVAMLAILKAGGAYLPLDPDYPADRLAFMLEDARVPVLLTQQRLLERLPANGATQICLDQEPRLIAGASDENPECSATAEHLAYAMYTSGSTGRPKGTLIPHRAVVRLVSGTSYARLGSEEVILQLAPISFDASTFEIWGALLNGARLVLSATAKPSLEELGRALADYGVTTLWLTAGLFHQMVEHRLEDLRGLRQLIAGGDVLSPARVDQAIQGLQGCRLINGYGPTECTTFSCCHRLTEADTETTSVPIGRPISNTTAHVLDGRMQPMPIGVKGELFVGGDGVARGYLNQPELTAARFLPDPFSAEPGARMYRTGDFARLRADGCIEYLGRRDRQAKIRGFRIEPAEIEAVLSRHPGVRHVVAVTHDEASGDTRLVAYVVPALEPSPSIEELREFMKRELPQYMLPSSLIFLEALPLDPNGKVNRNALPQLSTARPGLEAAFVAPRTPGEKMLAEIWSEVLELDRIGVHDNFFALGGHSLLGTRVVSRIREAFRVELPLRCLFEAPTIAELLVSVSEASQTGSRALAQSRATPIERVSRTSRRTKLSPPESDPPESLEE